MYLCINSCQSILKFSFKGTHYPDYCNGNFYAINMRTGLFLAEAATMIPSIGLHDTFLTGIEFNIVYTFSKHCLMLFSTLVYWSLLPHNSKAIKPH